MRNFLRRRTPSYAQRAAEVYRFPLDRTPSETPLFDQAVYATGTDPSASMGSVVGVVAYTEGSIDALLDDLDLLALPIATGTLRGPREGVAA